jgi:hypothetical protein
MLSLSFFLWKFVRTWKKVKATDKPNIEEHFFDNWGVLKNKNGKYLLTYISKLDGNVKHKK